MTSYLASWLHQPTQDKESREEQQPGFQERPKREPTNTPVFKFSVAVSNMYFTTIWYILVSWLPLASQLTAERNYFFLSACPCRFYM